MEPRTQPMSATEAAAATPDARDRYVDLLRVISIGVVVFGHWLMAVIIWKDAGPTIGNVLGIAPGAWLATWLLQVMPLFFFVGGFSNAVALASVERRGGGKGEFLASRAARLLRPTAIFIGVWMVAGPIVQAATGDALGTIIRDIGRPLWFLGIYLIVVALAPAMLKLHRRYGAAVPIAFLAGVVVVDVARRAFGVPYVMYLNFGFVWLFAHQLGFFYADGSLTRLSRTTLARIGGVAVAALAVLVGSGLYPGSMVGVPGEKISNMNPPTICLVLLTVWLVMLSMLFRDAGNRWLQNRRVWAKVIAGNAVIMTVFLWHLTAMLVVASVVYPAGFPQPAGNTGTWWLLRPVWIGMLLAALVPFVWIFGRYERPKAKPVPDDPGTAARAFGATCLILGVLGTAIAGFSDPLVPAGRTLIVLPVFPALNLAFLVAGTLALRAPAVPGGRPKERLHLGR